MVTSIDHPEHTAPKINWGLYDDQAGLIHPHEPLEYYVVGGFHPTALGDTFKDGRYVIHRKLGYGGRSTVWLATDKGERGARTGKNYVSIKIKSAWASALGSRLDDDPEIIKLRKLESHYLSGTQDQSRTYVRLLDCFVHDGPNGKHSCLVTELLGPSLRSVMYSYKGVEQVLRPDTILRASRQLFDAVDFAHQAGLIHGDISPANVVFTCNALQNDEDEDIVESLSTLFVAKARGTLPSPHLPKELVATSNWDLWDDNPAEEIRLIDWGEALSVDETVDSDEVAQPGDLRAPETFFIGRFDYRHDLWRSGCVVYCLVYQERIFAVGFASAHFLICKMIAKLGPLPDSWLPKFQEIRKLNQYAEKDEANIEEELIENTFEIRRQALILAYNEGKVSEESEGDEYTDYDFSSLSQLLQPMKGLLRFDREARITPKQASAMVGWIDYRREHSDGRQGDRSAL